MFPTVLSILLQINLNGLVALLGHFMFLLVVFLTFLKRNGRFTPKMHSEAQGCCVLFVVSVPIKSTNIQLLLHDLSAVRTFIMYTYTITGRDSSVGIATRYGLDGPGIESR